MDVWEDGTWSDIRAMTRDYLQGRRDTTHEMYGPPDPAHIASDGPALLELNELGVVTTDGQHQIAHTQRAYVDGMFVVPQGIEWEFIFAGFRHNARLWSHERGTETSEYEEGWDGELVTEPNTRAGRGVLYPFEDHEVDTFERLVPPGHVLVCFEAWERRWDVETSTLLTDVCDRIRTAALPLMK